MLIIKVDRQLFNKKRVVVEEFICRYFIFMMFALFLMMLAFFLIVMFFLFGMTMPVMMTRGFSFQFYICVH